MSNSLPPSFRKLFAGAAFSREWSVISRPKAAPADGLLS